MRCVPYTSPQELSITFHVLGKCKKAEEKEKEEKKAAHERVETGVQKEKPDERNAAEERSAEKETDGVNHRKVSHASKIPTAKELLARWMRKANEQMPVSLNLEGILNIMQIFKIINYGLSLRMTCPSIPLRLQSISISH